MLSGTETDAASATVTVTGVDVGFLFGVSGSNLPPQVTTQPCNSRINSLVYSTLSSSRSSFPYKFVKIPNLPHVRMQSQVTFGSGEVVGLSIGTVFLGSAASCELTVDSRKKEKIRKQ